MKKRISYFIIVIFIFMIFTVFISPLIIKKIHLPFFVNKKLMRNIEYLSDDVIISNTEVKIPNLVIYNPAIIENEDNTGYYFLVRIDNKIGKTAIIDLDNNLNVIENSFRTIKTNAFNIEDCRVFRYNDKYYITFNAILDMYKKARIKSIRHMHIAEIDMKTGKCSNEIFYELNMQRREKNWSPFIYDDKLHFVYNIDTNKILEVENISNPKLIQTYYRGNFFLRTSYWDWGKLRGGTPAIKTDEGYFSFFHSRFEKKILGVLHKRYHFGLYIYDNTPPFNITKISKFPIIPKDFAKDTILYPSGFVIGEMNGKKVFHIALGVNDNKCFILTLDKEKYLKNYLRDVKKLN